MKLLKEINTLLSEYYGENIAINIDGSRTSTSCDRSHSNLDRASIDNSTIDKEAMGFHANSVLIGVDEQADRGFSIFQETTYFNIDPDLIFLVN